MLFTKTNSFKIILVRINFTFKITLFRKAVFLKIVLFKIACETQNLRILQGQLSENVIFCVQNFFQKLPFKNNFIFFKHVLFKNIKHVSKLCFLQLNFPLQVLTRRKDFKSESNMLYLLLIQNLARCKNSKSESDT